MCNFATVNTLHTCSSGGSCIPEVYELWSVLILRPHIDEDGEGCEKGGVSAVRDDQTESVGRTLLIIQPGRLSKQPSCLGPAVTVQAKGGQLEGLVEPSCIRHIHRVTVGVDEVEDYQYHSVDTAAVLRHGEVEVGLSQERGGRGEDEGDCDV